VFPLLTAGFSFTQCRRYCEQLALRTVYQVNFLEREVLLRMRHFQMPLFRRRFAVYCVNRQEGKHAVWALQSSTEAHYSATETNRLMLFGETVAVHCENHTEHTDTIRTSQEIHYVSGTEANRLMLFRETVAVHCENHTEHTDTVRPSQETHDISATQTNRLMLFRETVAVHCENHTKHTDTVRPSQETHYISATQTNRLMLFKETVAVHCENHTEHTDTACTSQETHYISATEANRLILFRETVAVHCENRTEHINAKRYFWYVKAGWYRYDETLRPRRALGMQPCRRKALCLQRGLAQVQISSSALFPWIVAVPPEPRLSSQYGTRGSACPTSH
jgi:hypothetical protein